MLSRRHLTPALPALAFARGAPAQARFSGQTLRAGTFGRTHQERTIYNGGKLAELGSAPPKSLADLADPRLRGRVMIPDISSGGGLEAVGAFALTAGGNEANIDPGLQLIRSIPDLRLWKAG